MYKLKERNKFVDQTEAVPRIFSFHAQQAHYVALTTRVAHIQTHQKTKKSGGLYMITSILPLRQGHTQKK